MKKNILKSAVCSMVALAMIFMPAFLRAQDAMSTNAPAMSDQTNAPVKKHRKHDWLVFNGKVNSIDTNVMTLTVGERTFEISSDTRITKDGEPAILSEGIVGDKVGGAYKKSDDGKLTATTIHFGKKMKSKSSEMNSETNSVGK